MALTSNANRSFAWMVPDIGLAIVSVGIGIGLGSGLLRPGMRRNKVTVTPPPHQEWKPGMPQPSPSSQGHVHLDPRDLKSCYSLIISAVVPRPIALISTQDRNGVTNLAPFSYFNAVAHDPPTLAVSICRKSKVFKKDTLKNIETSGEFVVSIMSEWFVEAANHSCGDFDPEADEMALAGLTPLPSTFVSCPRVKESAVNMECKVTHMHGVKNKEGEETTTVVLGEVVMFHVLPFALDEAGAGEGKPTVRLEDYEPMGRMGGNTYARVTSTFDIHRPRIPASKMTK